MNLEHCKMFECPCNPVQPSKCLLLSPSPNKHSQRQQRERNLPACVFSAPRGAKGVGASPGVGIGLISTPITAELWPETESLFENGDCSFG